MEITDKEINEAAKAYLTSISPQEGEPRHVTEDFSEGAQWAIQKLQPEWIPVEPRTPELSQRLSSTDARLIQCLFDNGEILAFNDDHPFAIMTHCCFLPDPPKQ